jgi:hypothetical protein
MLVRLEIILLLLNPDTLALNALLNLPPTRSSEEGRWGYQSHCCDTSSELLTRYAYLQLRSPDKLFSLTAIELTSMVQKPAKKKSSTQFPLLRDTTVTDCPRALVETTGSNLE